MTNTTRPVPPQEYQAAVFSGQRPAPSLLVASGRHMADYEADRERFERRQTARRALDRDVPALERKAAEIADAADYREIAADAALTRSRATVALNQTASPASLERLQTLVDERHVLLQRCQGRKDALDCERLIAQQRERCEQLAVSTVSSDAEKYKKALDRLRAVERLAGQRASAVAEEERDRARLGTLDAEIADAKDALLVPANMTWQATPKVLWA